MMRGILTRFSLQKSQVTWRVIKIFAGCRWLKFIHQTAAPVVRCFLNLYSAVDSLYHYSIDLSIIAIILAALS